MPEGRHPDAGGLQRRRLDRDRRLPPHVGLRRRRRLVHASSAPPATTPVSFTSPAVQKLGFVYKAGDIPAPADYDGVGRDEFAIYRPSTGQFFILNTPNAANPATWTLRTVTLNLPGGPNVNDVPVSEDYDGNGKADPTVYRPSNSTFYIIHSPNGHPVEHPVRPGRPVGRGGRPAPLPPHGPLRELREHRRLPHLGTGTAPGAGGGFDRSSRSASGGGSGGATVHAESVASPAATPAPSSPSSPLRP